MGNGGQRLAMMAVKCALAPVLIIEIEFTSSEIEGLRLRVPVNFAEPEKAIGDPADLAASRSGNHMNVGDVVAESTSNGAMADRFHLGEGIDEAIVLAFFKGLDKDLTILGSGEVIDFHTDTDDFAKLSASAHGGGFDSFILHMVAREKRKGADGKQTTQKYQTNYELVSFKKTELHWTHFPSLFRALALVSGLWGE